MHRAYQPYTPVSNVFLKQKWDRSSYMIHRKKLAAAKAVIDNRSPKVYLHLNTKLKKHQEEAYRAHTISRDNKLLSEKMNHIMRTGGYTNHRNNYQSISLNGAKHKRELTRVAAENSMMLQRILVRNPNYSHQAFLNEWQESRQYLVNVSKYPPPRSALVPIVSNKPETGNTWEDINTPDINNNTAYVVKPIWLPRLPDLRDKRKCSSDNFYYENWCQLGRSE
ncbi:sperm axonemal maintenance protein CFAP97D1-like [Dreissena polymorpha]|uniref:Uncharacterized protein n=1 Tax=Dreissena polymorpha TaxID=45954 RepID=A0A9D4RV04_DREPO|nr:sperm axonemal maintenance protein CFAP97D1-like [Dreissena polymorpha]KAH3882571.1 hypothetical protein DPMN_006512 [Dreissena polymorpha]